MSSWLTIAQAAARLDIPERTLRERARKALQSDGYINGDRRLPVIRIGREYRIPAGVLEAMEGSHAVR